MKKNWIIIGIIAIVLIILYRITIGAYNNMVSKEELVNEAWANVQTQYQRRLDLIPNLVNTVKGYAQHEKDVFTQVTEARSKVGSIQVDPDKLDEASLKKFQEAQAGLSSALARLLAVAERYPDLKANQNFLELQAQLEGTENRIAYARDKYNEAARNFNQYIRKFPNNIIANMFGFDRKPYFEAEQGGEKAPEVKF
jgi:LemA protein